MPLAALRLVLRPPAATVVLLALTRVLPLLKVPRHPLEAFPLLPPAMLLTLLAPARALDLTVPAALPQVAFLASADWEVAVPLRHPVDWEA